MEDPDAQASPGTILRCPGPPGPFAWTDGPSAPPVPRRTARRSPYFGGRAASLRRRCLPRPPRRRRRGRTAPLPRSAPTTAARRRVSSPNLPLSFSFSGPSRKEPGRGKGPRACSPSRSAAFSRSHVDFRGLSTLPVVIVFHPSSPFLLSPLFLRSLPLWGGVRDPVARSFFGSTRCPVIGKVGGGDWRRHPCPPRTPEPLAAPQPVSCNCGVSRPAQQVL